MKKIIIIVICIILVVVLAVGFLRNKQTPQGPSSESGEQTSGEVALNKADGVVIFSQSIPITKDHKFIDIVYPIIMSFKDGTKQDTINNEIFRSIDGYRNEMDIIDDSEADATLRLRYVVSYEKYTYDKYLFLVVSHDYNSGGIRSVKYKEIFSIDVEKESLISLSEMFRLGVKYEPAIINEIEKQAKAKDIELMGGNGIDHLKQSQKFYVKDGKLIIYFAPAEIAANRYGELSFEMPFTINEDGKFDINT